MIIVEESSDLCNYHKFSSRPTPCVCSRRFCRTSIHRISIANYMPVKHPSLLSWQISRNYVQCSTHRCHLCFLLYMVLKFWKKPFFLNFSADFLGSFPKDRKIRWKNLCISVRSAIFVSFQKENNVSFFLQFKKNGFFKTTLSYFK